MIMSDDVQEPRFPELEVLLPKLRDAVADIVSPRRQFASFFEAWVADTDHLEDPPVGFLYAVISALETARQAGIETVDPANDKDAYALALSTLGAESDILDCLGAAVLGGHFDSPESRGEPAEHRRTTMKKMSASLGTKPRFARIQRASRQRVTDVNQIWTDPGHLLPALLLARRRLCRIETFDEDERPVKGTGFLIGPSAVLTNHHVVRDLADELSQPDDLVVRFDYSPTTGLEMAESSIHRPENSWCIAKSATEAVESADAPDTGWWTDQAQRNDWLSEVQDDLDYAVIRLSSAPGLQRGWYDVSRRGTRRSRAGCWVLHHPSGTGQTVTEGHLYYAGRGAPSRLFHTASTVEGSSGGLLLNAEGDPIGLHYAGLGEDPYQNSEARKPDEVMNAAIALDRIAEDLQAKEVTEELAERASIHPARGCLEGGRPVFGRTRFFGHLETVIDGDKPIMSVSVSPSSDGAAIRQPGKSFTIDMIENLLPQPENAHIVLKAHALEADAVGLAEMILEELAPDRIADLPRDADTTSPAYVKRLVDHIGSVMSERSANRRVWLMLDDLDVHRITDASGNEFLTTLYSRISSIPNLRIVLIGLEPHVLPGGIDIEKVQESLITADDYADIEQLLGSWLDRRGARDIGLDETSRTLLVKSLASYAGTEAPLSQLASFVTEHMREVTESIFGPDAAGAAAEGGE